MVQGFPDMDGLSVGDDSILCDHDRVDCNQWNRHFITQPAGKRLFEDVYVFVRAKIPGHLRASYVAMVFPHVEHVRCQPDDGDGISSTVAEDRTDDWITCADRPTAGLCL